MRFGAQDLAETTERDKLIQRLARVDQNELWVAAEALVIAHRRLEEEADAVGSSVEDAEVIERIEERHEAFEKSQADAEQVRRATFLIAGFAALLSRAHGAAGRHRTGSSRWPRSPRSPCWCRWSTGAATNGPGPPRRPRCPRPGAQSYLGFHLQRVNSLLSSDLGRQRLIKAAEEHRDAAQRWHALAGDIDVNWAVANRAEITGAARLRADVQPFAALTDDTSPHRRHRGRRPRRRSAA